MEPIQYQWTIIRSRKTNKSIIKDSNKETKTTKDSTFKYDVGLKPTQRSKPWIKVLTFDWLAIKTAKLRNENNKLKMLVQSINQPMIKKVN